MPVPGAVKSSGSKKLCLLVDSGMPKNTLMQIPKSCRLSEEENVPNMHSTSNLSIPHLQKKIEKYTETFQKSLSEPSPSFRWAVVTLQGEIIDCGDTIPFENETTLFSTER